MMEIVFFAICELVVLFVFFNYIYPKYKEKTYRGSFNELCTVLTSVTNSELDMFEKDIFRNNRVITKANFDTYYMMLSTNILERISPQLKKEFYRYVTEDMLISLVARTVKIYLTNRMMGQVHS